MSSQSGNEDGSSMDYEMKGIKEGGHHVVCMSHHSSIINPPVDLSLNIDNHK